MYSTRGWRSILSEKRFQVIQYIIIEIDEHSPGVGGGRVLAVGDNVSLGTAGRVVFSKRTDYG